MIISFHHRVTQSFTEFNQFEIKRIELRETLCYSVVKTHYHTVLSISRKPSFYSLYEPIIFLSCLGSNTKEMFIQTFKIRSIAN